MQVFEGYNYLLFYFFSINYIERKLSLAILAQRLRLIGMYGMHVFEDYIYVFFFLLINF